MRLAAWIVLASAVAGCDTCGSAPLAAQGICEPRIQVGTQATISIVHESDSGPMPAEVQSATVGDPAIATATIDLATDRLTLSGVAVGETTVELRVRGYESLVWFPLSVEALAPVYACDGRSPPGFDLMNGSAAGP